MLRPKCLRFTSTNRIGRIRPLIKLVQLHAATTNDYFDSRYCATCNTALIITTKILNGASTSSTATKKKFCTNIHANSSQSMNRPSKNPSGQCDLQNDDEVEVANYMTKIFYPVCTNLQTNKCDVAVKKLQVAYEDCIQFLGGDANKAELLVKALFIEKSKQVRDHECRLMVMNAFGFSAMLVISVIAFANINYAFDELPFAYREIISFSSIALAAFFATKTLYAFRIFRYFRTLVVNAEHNSPKGSLSYKMGIGNGIDKKLKTDKTS